MSGAASQGGELLEGVRWLAGAHSGMKVRSRILDSEGCYMAAFERCNTLSSTWLYPRWRAQLARLAPWLFPLLSLKLLKAVQSSFTVDDQSTVFIVVHIPIPCIRPPSCNRWTQ